MMCRNYWAPNPQTGLKHIEELRGPTGKAALTPPTMRSRGRIADCWPATTILARPAILIRWTDCIRAGFRGGRHLPEVP